VKFTQEKKFNLYCPVTNWISLPGEEVKRSGHEVDPADGANVGGPDEGVTALELLNFGSNRFGRSENMANCYQFFS
jgi:hypothetical protein